MVNADALCRCSATKEYPYLYQDVSNSTVIRTKLWGMSFDLIYFIRIKNKPNKRKYYLFGSISFLSIRSSIQ